MKPVCPIAPHEGAKLITFAEDQPEYTPLTASVDTNGVVMSEWEPTAEELDSLLAGARIRLWMHTCRPAPLPPLPMPVQLEVSEPLPGKHPLTLLFARVHEANKKWWTDINTGDYPIKRNIGELLMLVTSELAEALEGDRKSLNDDKLPHRRMFDVEIIDALIRLFDIAGALVPDAAAIFQEKMAFNAVRKDHTIEHRLTNNGKKY